MLKLQKSEVQFLISLLTFFFSPPLLFTDFIIFYYSYIVN